MGFLINVSRGYTPLHKHKNYEIIICTKGIGIVNLKDKDIKINPGEFLIVPPGVMHKGGKNETEYELIYINGEFEHVFQITSPIVIKDNSTNDGFTLAKMIYSNRHGDSAYLLSLINALTHFLLQNIKRKNKLFLAAESIVEEIGNYFYNSNLELNDILKKSGYAEDYIRAEFKNITGKTPTEFLNETRIKHACYLIEVYKGSLPLTDIAGKCGFLDYAYFSRKFKQIIGISPRKYSEELAEKNS